jgi:hypothetical protein
LAALGSKPVAIQHSQELASLDTIAFFHCDHLNSPGHIEAYPAGLARLQLAQESTYGLVSSRFERSRDLHSGHASSSRISSLAKVKAKHQKTHQGSGY